MDNVEKHLIILGYQQYPLNEPYVQKFFQKRAKNCRGETIYFINVTFYQFPDQSMQYSIKTCLYKKINGQDSVFYIEIPLDSHLTIQDIEYELANMYRDLNCCIDPHNND